MLAACAGEEKAPTRRPNVVLIVVDTLRADAIEDLSQLLDTPQIDRLASEGIAFPRAYTHAPMTLPSHVSLFSSRVPAESGVLNNHQSVPDDLPLLAEWLQKYGYSTRALLSLGTLNPIEGELGLSRGFDAYDTQYTHLDWGERVGERLRSMLDSWPALNGESDQPFFLFAHYSDPHAPYRSHETLVENVVVRIDGDVLGSFSAADAPQLDFDLELAQGAHVLELESSDQALIHLLTASLKLDHGVVLDLKPEASAIYAPTSTHELPFVVPEDGTARLHLWVQDLVEGGQQLQRYLSEVEYVDAFAGQLLENLRERGVYDNTLIVFASDHGEALGERGLFGHVEYLFDPLLRVPLILKPPGGPYFAKARVALAERREDPVSLIDVVPTVLELCALPALPGQRGESLLGPRDKPFEHLAQTHKPEAAQDRVSLFDGTLRMVYNADEDRLTLFDLSVDPQEERDIFEARGHEQPDWPERLRALAESAEAITAGEPDLDDDRKDMLRALGY